MRRDLDKAPEGVNLQDAAYIKKTSDKMPDVVRGLALCDILLQPLPHCCRYCLGRTRELWLERRAPGGGC